MAYRAQLSEALDVMYEDYSRQVRELEAYLARLKKGENLTPTEKIEKEMVEAWSVLVYKHEVLKPKE
jgi:hypothetical protein